MSGKEFDFTHFIQPSNVHKQAVEGGNSKKKNAVTSLSIGSTVIPQVGTGVPGFGDIIFVKGTDITDHYPYLYHYHCFHYYFYAIPRRVLYIPQDLRSYIEQKPGREYNIIAAENAQSEIFLFNNLSDKPTDTLPWLTTVPDWTTWPTIVLRRWSIRIHAGVGGDCVWIVSVAVWLVDWLTHTLTDWQTGWITDRGTHWMTDCPKFLVFLVFHYLI